LRKIGDAIHIFSIDPDARAGPGGGTLFLSELDKGAIGETEARGATAIRIG
jgi:hypothetical protein